MILIDEMSKPNQEEKLSESAYQEFLDNDDLMMNSIISIIQRDDNTFDSLTDYETSLTYHESPPKKSSPENEQQQSMSPTITSEPLVNDELSKKSPKKLLNKSKSLGFLASIDEETLGLLDDSPRKIASCDIQLNLKT